MSAFLPGALVAGTIHPLGLKHPFPPWISFKYPLGYKVKLSPSRKAATMCRAITCKICQKTTWAGCGQHIEQVMQGVPRNQRCEGHEQEKSAGGFFARLLGR